MDGETRSQRSQRSIRSQGEYPADGPRYIQTLTDTETVYESPIDINISKTKEIQVPPLTWHHLDLPPKKMKVTNSGYTLILSAKWHQERPYISGGPLLGNYVFSQLHFHWGKNDGEGSEHTIDGVRYPIEMHVVFFKANYLTQESALKEKDGIVVLVYMFKGGKNEAFQVLIDHVMEVQKPHTSRKLNPLPLSYFVKKFEQDYLLYWGSVTTTVCLHYILWLISREPMGVAAEQVDELRSMLDANEELLQGNFREVQSGRTQVFHANPSGSKYATLLALP
ncbi:Carbonic anhydrase 3-like Protein [Tribolium castaneum]|uniref:Carbonic anhydrase n=1 Tax=Tribolium castaneum TaxID=7070 RepID=D6W9D3_TRICA|nr:Carbonic anhydrase 3-like Protein [Tribolium castaneum]